MTLLKKFFIILMIICLVGVPAMAEEGEHNGYIVKYRGEDDFVVCDEIPMQLFSARSGIEYIEPNYRMYLIGNIPADPLYANGAQWNLRAMKVQKMWEQGYRGEGVKIAVIDSGVNDTLPEIYHCLEKGVNSVDGANPADCSDSSGHGTFICGIIGAQWNDYATAGIAPDAKIMPIKCTQKIYNEDKGVEEEGAYTADVARGVKIAVESGCKIINMSLGSLEKSLALENEINIAYESGAIMFAAVGNDKTTQFRYPAGYDNVIGIGAVFKDADSVIKHAPYSNYNNSVFAVAPGGCVFKDENKQIVYADYVYSIGGVEGTGTSFSAPTVAAVAALALCKNPGLNHDSFAAVLKNSCRDAGARGYDIYYGYGMIDCEAMLKELDKNELYFTDSQNCEDGFLETYIVNFGNEEINAKAFSYEKDGNALKDFKVHSLNLKKGEGKRINVPRTENDSGVLAFWDNLLKPLAESRAR